ncbi:MAG: S-methyl-5-thioribose-1-phosphate isomerase [Acidobacteria bacterium]|nr:S-methyl-5-thioribose-1-phosphate isomerase [Acidobacteriota bacterium]
MRVGETHYRSIWRDGERILVIDQTRLPHEFEVVELTSLEETADAIRRMVVRGAPLIGVTAAYGLHLAMREDASDAMLGRALELLRATRPTAVNLGWALQKAEARLRETTAANRADVALDAADELAEHDVATNAAIGRSGIDLLRLIHRERGGKPVRILTHCNAGWLATVDYGTALSPIFMAQDGGIPVHVWVDETRPRNQGSSLTAWELGSHGISHDVIVDNAGGHLMQRGMIDVVITGTDRVAANGDVCNKIGTYLKALAAADNEIPFYVAMPTSTLDPSIANGDAIPIEERSPDEITHLSGIDDEGTIRRIRLTPEGCSARNVAFDVTPAALVTGLITEHGLVSANPEAIRALLARSPA